MNAKKPTRAKASQSGDTAYLADEERMHAAEQSITHRKCFMDVIDLARNSPRAAKDMIRKHRKRLLETTSNGSTNRTTTTKQLRITNNMLVVPSLLASWRVAPGDTMRCLEAVIAAAADDESKRNRLLRRDQLILNGWKAILAAHSKARNDYRKKRTDEKAGTLGKALVEFLAREGLKQNENAVLKAARKLGLSIHGDGNVQKAGKGIQQRVDFVDVIEHARAHRRTTRNRNRQSRAKAATRELDREIRAETIRNLHRIKKLNFSSTPTENEAELAAYNRRNPAKGKRAIAIAAKHRLRTIYNQMASGSLGAAIAQNDLPLRLLVRLWSYAPEETLLCIEAIIAAATDQGSERTRILKRDEALWKKWDPIQNTHLKATQNHRNKPTGKKPGTQGAAIARHLAAAGISVKEKAADKAARKFGLRSGVSTDEDARLEKSIAQKIDRTGW